MPFLSLLVLVFRKARGMKMKKIFLTMLAVIISFTVVSPQTFAAEQEQQMLTEEQSAEIERLLNDEDFQQEIENGILLQSYVTDTGEFIVFDHVKALEDGIDPTLVNEVKADYDKTNAYFAEQSMKSSLETAGLFKAAAKANCSGAQKYVGNIVSGTAYIDSCKTARIISLMNGGASATALVALIPSPGTVPAGIIGAAIFGLGSAVISYNAANGTGIKIKLLRNPITKKTYPYWIKPQ